MSTWTTRAVAAAAAIMFATGVPSLGAAAAEPPVHPVTHTTSAAPDSVPSYDPAIASPGADDLTWAEVARLEAASSGVIVAGNMSRLRRISGAWSPPGALALAGASGQRCTIDTGDVYKRSSGNKYKYGSVGGHPRTVCNVPMVKITQSTMLYKTVWWELQHVAGPFNSSNTGEAVLEQKKVEKICDDLRETTFRMVVRGTGTFPTGTSGSATAFEEAKLKCGTNKPARATDQVLRGEAGVTGSVVVSESNREGRIHHTVFEAGFDFVRESRCLILAREHSDNVGKRALLMTHDPDTRRGAIERHW